MTNLEKLIKLNERLKKPYVLKKLSKNNYFLATQDFINYSGLDGNVFSSKKDKYWKACVRNFNQVKSILQVKSFLDTEKNFKIKIILNNRIVEAGKDDDGLFTIDYSKEISDLIKIRVDDFLFLISRDDFKKIEVIQ